MSKSESKRKIEVREGAVVPTFDAWFESERNARMFLARVLDPGDSIEYVPMEATAGESISFVTACDGRGWTLRFETRPLGSSELMVRVVNAMLVRNDSYDVKPREYAQYRITFYESAKILLDPFELAWLLSKHDVTVTAKNETPALFVCVRSREGLLKFAHDVNRQWGHLIIKTIEGAGPQGYEEIEF
jgi:hypothetical protein